jgi:large subunit ribosomal protein L5
MLSLKQHYSDSVINELKETLKLSTGMAVPKITKVTINMGVGEVITDKKVLENAVEDLTSISGQKHFLKLSYLLLPRQLPYL